MPRSRSLFASLPRDLKRSIRDQPSLALAPTVTTSSSSLTSLVTGNEFLPTQPQSPSSLPEIEVPKISLNTAESSKRTYQSDTSDFDTPTSTQKERKGKGRANDYQGHKWDCSGLIHRYNDISQVPVELKKYFAQRSLYFAEYDRLPILIDDVGWFSVTPQPIAAHIAERCRSDVIIDAFCGVGGNAIEFAKTCERVIAIDNDPTRLQLARHNALHCGVADRIEFVLADFVQWATKRSGVSFEGARSDTVDVIFLSPPWGGPEYLSYGKSYPLSAVEPVPGDELFKLCHAVTPNLAYYLPRNVDLRELANLAKDLDISQPDGPNGEERKREWVEVEEEWVGDKLKAVTAYFGGLVAE